MNILKSPKLTLFEAFVNWHMDFMGDCLLTFLFCLFCLAIAGLLSSILAFGGHGSLVQDLKEGKKDSFRN